jgi:hypothetical protein
MAMALVFTLADNPRARFVPEKWMKLALEIVENMIKNVIEELVPHVADTKTQRDCNKVFAKFLELLKDKGRSDNKQIKRYVAHLKANKVPRSLVSRLVPSVTAKELDEIERTLVGQDRIVVKMITPIGKDGRKKQELKIWTLGRSR